MSDSAEQFFQDIMSDVKGALSKDAKTTFAILGHTPTSYDLMAYFSGISQSHRLLGTFDAAVAAKDELSRIFPLSSLADVRPNYVIVASDREKQQLLEAALPYLVPETRMLFAGCRHFEFQDSDFDDIARTAFVPSLANGYPYSLVHLYQCLRNAARRGLAGVVVEFGMFKGGTTMLLSRFIERLGQEWKVIGFDTFSGFPPKRSLFDMYDHPDCFFYDEAIVRRYVEGRNIEVVPGDIVKTVARLQNEDIILAFVDTDNFTPASAALETIQERIVPGGAIVFDHFTGRDRFRYTLGERIAANRLVEDIRYFNLHDTGVFFRQL